MKLKDQPKILRKTIYIHGAANSTKPTRVEFGVMTGPQLRPSVKIEGVGVLLMQDVERLRDFLIAAYDVMLSDLKEPTRY